ncbi:glycoside hydrolase family 5 protein [Phanerochaete sordida]|uniref:cellulase n=1 Tax=Phanerochaete sordida TaxID=48140 RepID=A0A9P3L8Y3_9APHY|nr:glycoside hydrolase family 5 protein [Phanerochaete sordida]
MKQILALTTLALWVVSARAQAQTWQQCGGIGWTGPTTCVAGSVCSVLNDYYSQCIPATVTGPTPPPTSSPTSVTSKSSSSSSHSTSTSTSSTVSSSAPSQPSGSCSPNLPPASAGKLRFAGVNIAGFDFGCNSDGSCTASAAWPPLTKYYGMDGAGQMQHFVSDDGFNVFRLPVGWQFLTNNVQGGPVNDANLQEYDDLVQACLATGASCIIDLHNYARWNGKIIGQGGPTDDVLAATWSTIASKYASNSKIIFGVMNEPHDIPDIVRWAQSVQAAVTAIRNAGATTQLILLPGNNWTSAETFVSNGSADALSKVTNPDGSVTNLIFDVHKYLDSDNSGTNTECVTNNIDNAWAPLAQWLRCHGRQAFNTETGGGNTASCATYLCQQIAFQKANSDVFLGYVGWAAGNFAPGYPLSETPSQSGSIWTDTSLVKACLAPKSQS